MFTEESLENVVIEYLKDIDYKYIHGSNLNRDNKEVLLLDRLEEFLININKEIPKSSIKEAIRKIRTFETNDVFTNNKLFQILYRRSGSNRLYRWRNKVLHYKIN